MKNEGRVLEQMAPLINPPFSNPFIPCPWINLFKSVSAQLVSAAPETDVFDVSNDDRSQYSETPTTRSISPILSIASVAEDTRLMMRSGVSVSSNR